MSDVVIRAEGLGKKYIIGHQTQRERYSSLRDSIARGVKTFARKAGDLVHGRPIIQGDELEEVWALRDLDFEIHRGEVVGIIGRNGAGKSTLLKILSRITEPTVGRVQISGRVASLLEVGTGFHPELSGRENIYLNGAILGMGRAEIRRKFDEIVAFSEVERFLDTPVKRYSSGMYMRLAFAVAAHLDPEILVVDEVLAVGDFEFQKKCLGKLGQIAHGGRTVLFVSHNMAAIRSLCERGLLLGAGRVAYSGAIEDCVRRFEHVKHESTSSVWIRPERAALGHLSIVRVESELLGRQPNPTLRLKIAFASTLLHQPALIAFDIGDGVGTPLMQALPLEVKFLTFRKPESTYQFDVRLPSLVPGEYWVTVWVGPHNSETFDVCRECVAFEILESPVAARTVPHTADHGCVVAPCTFVDLSK